MKKISPKFSLYTIHFKADEEEKKLEKAEEEIKKIPDDFFYNYEEMISQPHITQDSGLPKDYLNLM